MATNARASTKNFLNETSPSPLVALSSQDRSNFRDTVRQMNNSAFYDDLGSVNSKEYQMAVNVKTSRTVS